VDLPDDEGEDSGPEGAGGDVKPLPCRLK
jgi:hypothetical protein